MGYNVSSPKRKHHVERNGDMLRRVRGGSRLGNENCEAARSEAGMSYESWIVRTRESKEDKDHGAGASSRGSAPGTGTMGHSPEDIATRRWPMWQARTYSASGASTTQPQRHPG